MKRSVRERPPNFLFWFVCQYSRMSVLPLNLLTLYPAASRYSRRHGGRKRNNLSLDKACTTAFAEMRERGGRPEKTKTNIHIRITSLSLAVSQLNCCGDSRTSRWTYCGIRKDAGDTYRSAQPNLASNLDKECTVRPCFKSPIITTT